MRSAIELLVLERNRQINEEGWSEEKDETYTDGQLARLASVYAIPEKYRTYFSSINLNEKVKNIPQGYPMDFNLSFWKPSKYDRIKELVKAGALILAEIERLQKNE